MDELISFEIEKDEESIIKVIGVGGGGSNAVTQMYELGIKDVNFVICNTDAQALQKSTVPIKIQLGETLTAGRGAGNNPAKGEESAIENLDEIEEILKNNTKMVFITAGMGGGTGTGAAPIIAAKAKELGILTIAIVTIPFKFEGKVRINQAIEGISELRQNVDSLLVINNEKLREIFGNQTLGSAFKEADNVLTTAAKGIAEIITIHGYVNVDFEDVKTVMQESDVAIMGSATAEGETRAIDAIKEALESPLLNNNDIRGAKNILLNITSGTEEITMDEVGEITDFVQEAVGDEMSSNIIWGTGKDETLGEKIGVTIIATGFGSSSIPELYAREKKEVVSVVLEKEPVIDIEKTPEVKPQENQTIVNKVLVLDDEEEEENIAETASITNATNFVNKEMEYDDMKVSIREKYEKLRSLNTLSEESITALENEPAINRIKRQDKTTNKTDDNEVSRYTISSDNDNQTQLRENNPYIHDNVD